MRGLNGGAKQNVSMTLTPTSLPWCSHDTCAAHVLRQEGSRNKYQHAAARKAASMRRGVYCKYHWVYTTVAEINTGFWSLCVFVGSLGWEEEKGEALYMSPSQDMKPRYHGDHFLSQCVCCRVYELVCVLVVPAVLVSPVGNVRMMVAMMSDWPPVAPVLSNRVLTRAHADLLFMKAIITAWGCHPSLFLYFI